MLKYIARAWIILMLASLAMLTALIWVAVHLLDLVGGLK